MARHYLPTLKDTKSVQPMTKKLTDMFLKCTMIELEKGFDEWTLAEAKEMGPLATLMWHRLAGYGGGNPAKVSIAAILIVLFQIRSPGDCVLWAFTLNRMWAQRGPVDIEHLADAFPEGFPDERGKEEIWDAQKVEAWGESPGGVGGSDNMLDHPEYLTDTENFIEKKEWCKWLVATT